MAGARSQEGVRSVPGGCGRGLMRPAPGLRARGQRVLAALLLALLLDPRPGASADLAPGPDAGAPAQAQAPLPEAEAPADDLEDLPDLAFTDYGQLPGCMPWDYRRQANIAQCQGGPAAGCMTWN